jgi:membrane protease YdiL (CAAX protease family)
MFQTVLRRRHKPVISKTYVKTEFLVLLIILPILILAPVSPFIILTSLLVAIMYIVYLSKKLRLFSITQLFAIAKPVNLAAMAIRFLGFLLISVTTLAFLAPDKLFNVMLNKPFLWLGLCIFYSVFSVYPQEFIYRHFYFNRYQSLFSRRWILILVNAVVFSLAHLFLLNALVLFLTFCGGILFSMTYLNNKSLMLVSAEHSLYGMWLFTVGMGDMLAFPNA